MTWDFLFLHYHELIRCLPISIYFEIIGIYNDMIWVKDHMGYPMMAGLLLAISLAITSSIQTTQPSKYKAITKAKKLPRIREDKTTRQ